MCGDATREEIIRYIKNTEQCPRCGFHDPLADTEGDVTTVSCDHCELEFAFTMHKKKGG